MYLISESNPNILKLINSKLTKIMNKCIKNFEAEGNKWGANATEML